MFRQQHFHFIGIGGIGMSGIAQVLLTLGNKVSGSDIRPSETIKQLRLAGAEVHIGHAAENVSGADVVIISSAIKKDNPEIRAAEASSIPIIQRAEMLAELMRLKKFGIAVAGTHGKTSTTSMMASVLNAGRLDPTVIIGGKVNSLKTNAYWGDGDFLLAEADESDGSFLRLTPCVAVVTNIDLEHLDHYPDLESIKQAFRDFLDKIPFYGFSVLCGDDPHLSAMKGDLQKKCITYGTGPEVDLRAADIRFDGLYTTYTAWRKDQPLGTIELHVPGMHHVQNSLAALATGLELGISFEDVAAGLRDYTGVGRRFDILGERNGILVVDDYAHHPTEIEATLKAARACWPERRLLVLFEPHRYTRTKALMDRFATAFDNADMLWITEIYPASEPPILGVTGKRLAKEVKSSWGGLVEFVKSVDLMPEAVLKTAQPGDVIITLGAGSIGRTGHQIYALLEQMKYDIAL